MEEGPLIRGIYLLHQCCGELNRPIQLFLSFSTFWLSLVLIHRHFSSCLQ